MGTPMRSWLHSILFCLSAIFVVQTSHCHAQTSTFRIEEDWELHISQPDVQLDAPQVSTMMLPGGGTSNLLFQIHLNHATSPSFSGGGYQLRTSYDDQTLSQLRRFAGQRLEAPEEIIKWTQVIQRSDTGFYYGVIDGESESWGHFGGSTSFVHISDADAGLSSLANYDVQDSIDNSGVSYAANRVGWLKIKKFRVILNNGESTEWTLNVQVE